MHIRIFRCRRCGLDLDTDIGEVRKCCRNCGSSHWQEKYEEQLLTKRDVYILYADTGVWIKNVSGETWLDRKIDSIAAIEDPARQDKAEREFADQLKASVNLDWEEPDA